MSGSLIGSLIVVEGLQGELNQQCAMSAERETVSGEALEQMIELLAVSRADGQAARCALQREISHTYWPRG